MAERHNTDPRQNDCAGHCGYGSALEDLCRNHSSVIFNGRTGASYTQLPCQICLCFTLFLFSIWQEIVLHARQTCEQQTQFLKQNFSATITPFDKKCV